MKVRYWLALTWATCALCGCGQDGSAFNAIVCHMNSAKPGDSREIRINDKFVAAHLAHGDYRGPCR